jgi:hypothetical protein
VQAGDNAVEEVPDGLFAHPSSVDEPAVSGLVVLRDDADELWVLERSQLPLSRFAMQTSSSSVAPSQGPVEVEALSAEVDLAGVPAALEDHTAAPIP